MSRPRARHAIRSAKVPPPRGPLSPAVRWGDLVFISGQTGKMPGSGELPAGIAAQTTQALENVRALLEEAGTSMDRVLKVTVFVTRHEDIERMNEIYRTAFGDPPPARSCVVVAALPRRDAVIEIECVAAV